VKSRFKPLLTAGVAAALVAATQLSGAGPAMASAPPSAWPSAGSDLGRSYWSSTEVTINPARVAALRLNYTIAPASDPAPGTDECTQGFNTPVESGGRLFYADYDGVSAYNQWSGARLWNVPPFADEAHYTATFQVVGANLVVMFRDCVSETNASSYVLVIDASTGAVVDPLWAPTDAVEGWVVSAGVLVADETNDDTGWIRAYSLAGSPLWSGPNGGCCYGGDPVVAGHGLAYAVAPSGDLVALRVADGSLAWSSAAVTPLALSRDGKDLYVGSGGLVRDLNPLTGAYRSLSVPLGYSSGIAVDATAVYVGCGTASLCAFRRSDGHLLWTAATTTWWYPQPLVADGVVYFAGQAFRVSNGKRIKSAADGTVVSSVSGGRVYASTAAGVVSYK
jgi:PQQ-like domain